MDQLIAALKDYQASANRRITLEYILLSGLNDSIDNLNKDTGSLANRVSKHGQEIDANREHLIIHDKEIEYLKKEVNK